MIIGGIAVIIRGVPRHTQDVDATVWGEGLDISELHGLLASSDIEPRIDDATAFAEEHQVLLLRHTPSGTPIDLSMAWLPFEREALDRATQETIAGVDVRVATPEDLVIFKAVAFRDRDRVDIEHLLGLHADVIDLDRVRRIVSEFAEVLEEPERLDQLEKIVRRTLSG